MLIRYNNIELERIGNVETLDEGTVEILGKIFTLARIAGFTLSANTGPNPVVFSLGIVSAVTGIGSLMPTDTSHYDGYANQLQKATRR